MAILFGFDGGVRQSFFGTNFLWLGWEIKAIFFMGRVAFDIDIPIQESFYPGQTVFSRKFFFFYTRTKLQGGKSRQYDESFLTFFIQGDPPTAVEVSM